MPHTGPGMRVAGLRGGFILALSVGLMGRLSAIKVVDLLTERKKCVYEYISIILFIFEEIHAKRTTEI